MKEFQVCFKKQQVCKFVVKAKSFEDATVIGQELMKREIKFDNEGIDYYEYLATNEIPEWQAKV